MFAAADVYASEEALENVFPHLNEKARVAAFGAKLSSSRLGKILNPFCGCSSTSLSQELQGQTTNRGESWPSVLRSSMSKNTSWLDVPHFGFCCYKKRTGVGLLDAVNNAIGYAKFYSRSHDAVIRVSFIYGASP
jgi:hypothetical protein